MEKSTSDMSHILPLPPSASMPDINNQKTFPLWSQTRPQKHSQHGAPDRHYESVGISIWMETHLSVVQATALLLGQDYCALLPSIYHSVTSLLCMKPSFLSIQSLPIAQYLPHSWFRKYLPNGWMTRNCFFGRNQRTFQTAMQLSLSTSLCQRILLCISFWNHLDFDQVAYRVPGQTPSEAPKKCFYGFPSATGN